MGSKQKSITSITYKGRSFGIIVLTAAQLLIGFIHAVTGLGLLFASPATLAYDSYTLVFGLLTLASGALIWQAKKTGWIVTVAALLFVTAADSLAVANLPSIPGIPTFAAPTEIGYSVIVIIYLLQPKVRRKFSA